MPCFLEYGSFPINKSPSLEYYNEMHLVHYYLSPFQELKLCRYLKTFKGNESGTRSWQVIEVGRIIEKSIHLQIDLY